MLETISESSLKLSKIIAGVMHWGKWGAKLDTATMSQLIEQCCELGITTFDHADIYGDHTTEKEFGLAFKQNNIDRKEIQLISKFGICYPNNLRAVKTYDTSTEHIISSVNQSLINLQTDYLDLLLIHRPSPLMDVEQIIRDFETLKKAGKVLHFGVSNFTPSQLDLFKGFPIVTNQIEASLLHLDPFTDGTIDQCYRRNIHPTIWSPFKGGQIFNTDQRTLKINQVVSKYPWSLDQAALLFLLKHPANLFPIIGTSKIERIKSAIATLKLEISNDQWFELWTASTGHKVA